MVDNSFTRLLVLSFVVAVDDVVALINDLVVATVVINAIEMVT